MLDEMLKHYQCPSTLNSASIKGKEAKTIGMLDGRVVGCRCFVNPDRFDKMTQNSVEDGE